MNELGELLKQQQLALKNGDFVALNRINKEIYAVRELKRKQKYNEKQKAKDDKLDTIITELLTR